MEPLKFELPVMPAHWQVAYLYFPQSGRKAASQKLSSRLKKNLLLMQELIETGHKPHRKFYSPRQLEIIFKHLGVPQLPSNPE